jgi:hypothetical protein
MEILNYTGKPVGLTNKHGNPYKVLPSQGKAHFVSIEANQIKNIEGVAIFQLKMGKVIGLPTPDWNQEKLYIVPKEIAEYNKNTRFDLLVVEDGFNWEGATFYKKLVQLSA